MRIARWNIVRRMARYRAGWFADPGQFRGSEHDEPTLLKFVPPIQRPAIELAAWFNAPIDQIAALRPGDVDEAGLRLRGRRVPWPDGMPKRLLAKLVRLASITGPKQRIFDGEKPARRAACDLRAAMWRTAALAAERDRLAQTPVAARLPDFLVLGVPRSATTWLYQALLSHPDIYLPATKEQEFFGDYLFHFGINWYLHHFTSRTNERIAGDVSVNYFNSEKAPAQVAELLGRQRVKLIVALREPIERARSYYNIRLPRGMAPSTFDEAISLPFFHELCIEHGHYVRYLRQWYQHIDPAQILVLLYEDVRRDPVGSLRRVCSFLGVAAELAQVPPPENSGTRVRHLHLHRRLCQTAADLDVLLPGPPAAIGAAAGRLLRRLDARLCLDGSDRHYRIPMRPETEQRLRDIFEPSNEALAQLTGLDLSAWRYDRAREHHIVRPLPGYSRSSGSHPDFYKFYKF